MMWMNCNDTIPGVISVVASVSSVDVNEFLVLQAVMEFHDLEVVSVHKN